MPLERFTTIIIFGPRRVQKWDFLGADTIGYLVSGWGCIITNTRDIICWTGDSLSALPCIPSTYFFPLNVSLFTFIRKQWPFKNVGSKFIVIDKYFISGPGQGQLNLWFKSFLSYNSDNFNIRGERSCDSDWSQIWAVWYQCPHPPRYLHKS